MSDKNTQHLALPYPLRYFRDDGPHHHLELIGRLEMCDIAHLLRGRNQDLLHPGPLLVESGVELIFLQLPLGKRLDLMSSQRGSQSCEDGKEECSGDQRQHRGSLLVTKAHQMTVIAQQDSVSHRHWRGHDPFSKIALEKHLQPLVQLRHHELSVLPTRVNLPICNRG